MSALVIKADGLKPQDASLVIPAIAGAALALTTPALTLQSDQKWDLTADASAVCHGVLVSISKKSATCVDTDAIGVCVFGVLGGFTGLTPGAPIFLAATDGTFDSAGTVNVGYALTDETIMFLPSVVSNPSA